MNTYIVHVTSLSNHRKTIEKMVVIAPSVELAHEKAVAKCSNPDSGEVKKVEWVLDVVRVSATSFYA